MEWIASEPLSDVQTERLLQHHLLQAVRQVLPETESNRALVTEAARSVAVYCAPALSDGIPTEDLHVLFSQALWSVGEVDSARHVLELEIESRRLRTTLTKLLSARGLTPDLWMLALSGVLRHHQPWMGFEDGPAWCLDVQQISGWPSDTELARSMAVDRIVSRLAPVWDATSGRGCLAVKIPAGVSGEECEWASARMVRLAAQRGWSHRPHVVRFACVTDTGQTSGQSRPGA